MVSDFELFLCEEEILDDFQVVGFHPRHCFSGEPQDDPSNFSNRSPYPMIHILRQASVTLAADRGHDVGKVPRSNELLLRTLHEVYRKQTKLFPSTFFQAEFANRVNVTSMHAWVERDDEEVQRASFSDFLSSIGIRWQRSGL